MTRESRGVQCSFQWAQAQSPDVDHEQDVADNITVMAHTHAKTKHRTRYESVFHTQTIRGIRVQDTQSKPSEAYMSLHDIFRWLRSFHRLRLRFYKSWTIVSRQILGNEARWCQVEAFWILFGETQSSNSVKCWCCFSNFVHVCTDLHPLDKLSNGAHRAEIVK